MFELFKLVGRVMVDASGANQALDGTDKKAQGLTGSLGGYMDKLKNWAAAAGAALAGSAIAKGLKEIWDLSSQVAEIGDNIDKASQKFLLSRQEYQRWDYIAQRSGTTIDAIGNAVYELSKKVGEGKEETLSLLEEIGVSAADAMTATPEELFNMVINGLRGVDDITRRTYIADNLLSGSAKDLAPIFNTTAEAANELDERYKELGGTMRDQLIDMSAKYKDAQTDFQEAWDGVKNHLAEDTLPGMTLIIDGLTQMLTGDFVNGLTTAADGVKSYLGGILETVRGWGSQIMSATGIDMFVLNPALLGPPSVSEDDLWAQIEADTSRGFGGFVSDLWQGISGFFGHANGLSFVPRDDYPARLHYGERVLTRQEAEEYNAGKSGGGNTTINISTVAQSPAQTAAAITAAMARARWAM